jgi:hypothetical protein
VEFSIDLGSGLLWGKPDLLYVCAYSTTTHAVQVKCDILREITVGVALFLLYLYLWVHLTFSISL